MATAIERVVCSDPVGGSERFQEEQYGSQAVLAKDRSRTAGQRLVVKGNLV